MHRTFETMLYLLALSTPVHAQQRDATLKAGLLSTRESAMVLATLGSAAGVLGGGASGVALCKATGWGDNGEDPCLGQLVIGLFAGSIVGSAIGAYIPTRKFGGGIPLGYAMGGMILGLGAGYATARLTGSPAGYLISYSVTQGVVTGLLSTRTLK